MTSDAAETFDRTPVLRRLAPLMIAPAVALLIGACVAWSHATPAPGQRSVTPAHAWTARCGATALCAAAHAALFGVALPGIYRPRPGYAALAATCGLASSVAGITWAALSLAQT